MGSKLVVLRCQGKTPLLQVLEGQVYKKEMEGGVISGKSKALLYKDRSLSDD